VILARGDLPVTPGDIALANPQKGLLFCERAGPSRFTLRSKEAKHAHNSSRALSS